MKLKVEGQKTVDRFLLEMLNGGKESQWGSPVQTPKGGKRDSKKNTIDGSPISTSGGDSVCQEEDLH